MKLTNNEYELLYNKLEYRFKKSNNYLIEKLNNKSELNLDDIKLLLNKLEYNFKKGGNEIIEKLKNM